MVIYRFPSINSSPPAISCCTAYPKRRYKIIDVQSVIFRISIPRTEIHEDDCTATLGELGWLRLAGSAGICHRDHPGGEPPTMEGTPALLSGSSTTQETHRPRWKELPPCCLDHRPPRRHTAHDGRNSRPDARTIDHPGGTPPTMEGTPALMPEPSTTQEAHRPRWKELPP